MTKCLQPLFALCALLSILFFVGCLEEPPHAGTGGSEDAPDASLTDTGSGDSQWDISDDDDSGADSGPSEFDTDADTGAEDDGGQQDTGEEDGGGQQDAGEEDTGPTGPPPECGGDLWDDTHDGENPWEVAMNCPDISASWGCQLADDEVRVVEIVNEMRAQTQTCGTTEYSPVGPVTMEPLLRCAARMHSWDQDNRGYYDHTTPEGVNPGARMSHVGFSAFGWGENIFMTNQSPEGAMQGWMNSAGHCVNIMNGSFTRIGVGRYGGHYVMKLS